MPSASLAFLSALEQVLTESGTLSLDETSLREALLASQPLDLAEGSWTGLLADLAERAARDVVTVYDVALAGWKHDEKRIRRVLAMLQVPLQSVRPLLTADVRDKQVDPPPPVRESGPPRFAVVIRSDTAVDYSNRYETFEDARFALAYLSWRFFGTERPPAPVGHHVSVVIRERIGSPRAMFIRELSSS
jgi:hypothetical protein